MELKIKKCPFCNGDAELYSANGKYGYFSFVQCTFCGSQGKTYSLGKEREENWADSLSAINAIKAWNTRIGDRNGR